MARSCGFLIGFAALACSGGDPAPQASQPAGGRASSVAEQLLAASAAREQDSGPASAQCGARFDPVVVVVVESAAAVQARRAREDPASVVSADAETVVFSDGRVVTSRLDEVGSHLGRLGWVEREIVISSRFQRRGGAARRRRG